MNNQFGSTTPPAPQNTDKDKIKDEVLKPQNEEELSAANLTAPKTDSSSPKVFQPAPPPAEPPQPTPAPAPAAPPPPPPPSTPPPTPPTLTPQPAEPPIGVELDKTKNPAPPKIPNPPKKQIEVADYTAPGKKTTLDIQTEEERPLPKYEPPAPAQPQTGIGKSVMIITGLAAIMLVGGFGGGFFGYQYWPKFLAGRTISADVVNKENTAGAPQKTGEPGQLDSWPIYSNTKFQYSVKYPDTWYGQNTGNSQAETVQFTSFKPSSAGSDDLTGFKIDIVFQDRQDKELKDWIEANNAAAQIKAGGLTQTKVAAKYGYQQTITSPQKSMATYLAKDDKVMIISYFAAEADFEKGKTIYNQLLSSLTLM